MKKRINFSISIIFILSKLTFITAQCGCSYYVCWDYENCIYQGHYPGCKVWYATHENYYHEPTYDGWIYCPKQCV